MNALHVLEFDNKRPFKPKPKITKTSFKRDWLFLSKMASLNNQVRKFIQGMDTIFFQLEIIDMGDWNGMVRFD